MVSVSFVHPFEVLDISVKDSRGESQITSAPVSILCYSSPPHDHSDPNNRRSPTFWVESSEDPSDTQPDVSCLREGSQGSDLLARSEAPAGVVTQTQFLQQKLIQIELARRNENIDASKLGELADEWTPFPTIG